MSVLREIMDQEKAKQPLGLSGTMPNPQIEFTLEFTEPIQRKEMALIFDPPIKYSRSSNHFTLDTDAVGGTGLWYADCKLIEIKNLINSA